MKGKTALFWFAVAFTFAAPVIIGLKFENSTTSWVAALCGGFLVLIARLDDIAELSLGPLKAKMRKTIAQAVATTEQLRDVATASARATLSTLISDHFLGGMKLARRFELHDSVISSLDQIGASEQQKLTADSEWQNGVTVIYHSKIGNAFQKVAEKEGKLGAEWNAIAEEWGSLFDEANWKAAEPAKMRSFLKNKDLLGPDVEKWLKDYEEFVKTGVVPDLHNLVAD